MPSGAVGFSISSHCGPCFDVFLDVFVQNKQKYIYKKAHLFPFGKSQDALLLLINCRRCNQ